MPLRLSFESGPLAGIHIVTSAEQIRLGRDPAQNDILLTNPKVSRKHAVIERSVRGGYSLEVMGTGPTKLNGDNISSVGGRSTVHALSTGDRIDFGGIEVVVSEASVKLIVVSGGAAGREIAIDGSVRLGSGRDCDLVLPDAGVAPEHLVISSTPLGFRAEIRAPVMFNGAPADARVLSHGDELTLGSTVVRFAVNARDEIGVDTGMSSITMAAASLVKNIVGELVFISGASKGDRVPLGDDQIILGTRVDCTTVLSDLLASPLHCAISKAGDHFVATDLGSEGGTYINGERIFQGTALKPGDLIAVGSHVLEARLAGGVTVANRGNTIFTTMSPGGGFDGPQPRFVIDGRVIKAKKCVLGRAPSCDVIVDGPAVSREHCTISWDNGFVLRDTSAAGTYVDDKRVVQQQLPPSGVLRVVDTLFRIAVRGEVCTIERTDAALAQAAVDVQRAKAGAHLSMLSRAINVSDVERAAMVSQSGHKSHAGGKGGEALRTIFRMDASALESEIAARKKDLKKGAPAWRPSSDLARDGALRGAVLLSVLAALALCGGALLFGGGRALLNHPLSRAHSSATFVEKAGGTTVCSGCHTAGMQVAVASCASCHGGFDARPKHASLDCGGCHREHRGDSPDRSLHALHSCTTSGCHPNQHSADFAPQTAPQKLAAGPIPDKPLLVPAMARTPELRAQAVVGLHAAHSRVTIGGADIGIQCTACHAALQGTDLVEGKPALACYRCHQGGEVAMQAGCEKCHGREHGKAMERLAPDAAGLQQAMSTPSPIAAVGWATGLAFVAGAPGLLFGTWVRIRRRRSQRVMVEELSAHPAEVVKRLVHSINDSKCVGCSMCVQACPASVLELVEHKSRVVNFDSCIQCKKCEHACAFDALRMHDADKPPPMIAMPSIDAFHETPVAGMFLIGQASGTPQVKNASNLGRAAIQRIAQQGFRPGLGVQSGCNVDIVIVGSGPAGLSAALTCIELGYSYVVLEKEREFAWTIRNYYHKGKEVMAEPNDVNLEATLPHWDSSREELLGAWAELVQQYRVDIRYQQNVIDIKKEGERFGVHVGDPKGQLVGQITCGRVVLAIGTLGNPRRLGCDGEDLEKVKNSLVDPDEWTGKTILVVGGSDSAVEVVLALAAPERRNQVFFSTRGAKLEGIKPKNRKLIEEALAANRFQMKYATTVAEVTPTSVTLAKKEDGSRETLPNDVVFAMIGGNSPQKWLQQIGVPYVDKPHSWSPPRTDQLSAKTAEGLIPVQRLVRRPLPQRTPHH